MNTTLALAAMALGQAFTNTSTVDVEILDAFPNHKDVLWSGTGSFEMQVDLTDRDLLAWGASFTVDDPGLSLEFVWIPWTVPAEAHPTYLSPAKVWGTRGHGVYEFGEFGGPMGHITGLGGFSGGEYPGDGHPPRLYTDELPDDFRMTYFAEEVTEKIVVRGHLESNGGVNNYKVRAYFQHESRDMLFDFDPILKPVPGDYDNDGTVGPGDLNLVLFNWDLNDVTSDWINQRPVGSVGAGELNSVLFNWSSTASVVPEPTGWLLMAVAVLVASAVAAAPRPFCYRPTRLPSLANGKPALGSTLRLSRSDISSPSDHRRSPAAS